MSLAVWKKTPRCLLAAAHNQLQRLRKQYMAFKLLQHFPSINHGAVTAFHTETSPFSHPPTTTFPLPTCLYTMPSLLPASSLFHSFCHHERSAMVSGSFGEQQELSSEPPQPFEWKECPPGRASVLITELRQEDEGQVSLQWNRNHQLNLLMGQEEKPIWEDIPLTSQPREQCCCKVSGWHSPQALTPQHKAFQPSPFCSDSLLHEHQQMRLTLRNSLPLNR